MIPLDALSLFNRFLILVDDTCASSAIVNLKYESLISRVTFALLQFYIKFIIICSKTVIFSSFEKTLRNREKNFSP